MRKSLGLRQPPGEFWMQLWGQLERAGGLFPLVAYAPVILLSPIVIITGGGVGPAVNSLSRGVAFLVGAPLLFVAGLIWAGVVGAVVLPVLALMLRLCREQPGRDRVGGLAGTLVAAVAVAPYGLWVTPWFGGPAGWLTLYWLALAIALGQAAGRLAGLDDLRRRRRGRPTLAPFRITVWRLLAVMIPLSVVMSFLQITDLLSSAMAIYWGVVLLFAAVTWKPVAWLVNRWLDRQLTKRRAKRRPVGAPGLP